MFKVSHRVLIIISGLVWFAVGCFLLPLGLNLLVDAIQQERAHFTGSYPLIDFLGNFFGSRENGVLIAIVVGLYIGYLKARHVLSKSVHKSVARIIRFPNPTSLGNIYSAKYYILLGLMIGLGVSIKFFGLSNDIRGLVDVVIGAALINGALIYFRCATETQKEVSAETHL